jgi:oligopeptide transport system substrate-binding protein
VDGAAETVGIPYNPEQAQQLLAEGGYPGGEGLPPILLVYNQSARNQEIAEYAQQNWLEMLNAPVALTGINDDIDSYLNLLKADPPQIWRLGLCSSYRDAYAHLAWFTGLLNGFFGAWDDAAYEAFLAQAARTAGAEERKLFYKFAEEVLVESDAILLPLYYDAVGMATAPTLIRTYGDGGYGGYIADWHVGWQLFLPVVASAAE